MTLRNGLAWLSSSSAEIARARSVLDRLRRRPPPPPPPPPAAEWPDNPNGKVRNIVLPDANALSSEFRADLLNGVQVIRGRAVGLAFDEKGGVSSAEQPFMAIPYATWANRGRGQMAVWLARGDAAARPTPYPDGRDDEHDRRVAAAERPRQEPAQHDRRRRAGNSADLGYFDWWPVQGSKSEWVEMTFAKPAAVSESQVYWFDDTGRGGVRVPASWRLLYKNGDQWTPVADVGRVRRRAQRLEHVTFTPVTTTALRIELVMQESFPRASRN